MSVSKNRKHSSNFQDITGQRFGRLIAIRIFDERPKTYRWLCRCDCGGKAIVLQASLKNGNTQSCGCLQRDRASQTSFIHGRGYSDPTYRAWHNMHSRCNNPKHPKYKIYGGRGIRICRRWYRFEKFLADMGPCPKGKTLDRFPNPDGDYKPSNCRWATPVQQAYNRRGQLTLYQRLAALARYNAGEPVESIAQRYNISKATVYRLPFSIKQMSRR